MGRSLVPVDDPAAGQVVVRELDADSVSREDADVVLPHLATDRRPPLVPVGQLDAEHRVRQGFDDRALQLECAFFLRHELSICCRNEEVDGARTPGHGDRPRSLRGGPDTLNSLGAAEPAQNASSRRTTTSTRAAAAPPTTSRVNPLAFRAGASSPGRPPVPVATIAGSA